MPIDLRSDTVTRPTDAMREAAATATVGDDVYGEDPTVQALEAAAAERLGKPAALFVPSGTMGNQIAVRVHTDRGDLVVADPQAHIITWEVGGMAQLSGVQVRTVDAPRGRYDLDALAAAMQQRSLHRPGVGLVTLENTHNQRGGWAVPAETVAAVGEIAADAGVPLHIDGARLFNACVATDTDPAEMAAPATSVLFCLSKGLGAPVGSMLVGEAAFIDEARRVRKLFGGGMRQAGIIAAPGLLALEDVERLAEDHANAARLADGLAGHRGVTVPTPETNIVQLRTEGPTAGALVDAAADAGVLGGAMAPDVVRLCTHRDVSTADIDTAIERLQGVLGARSPA